MAYYGKFGRRNNFRLKVEVEGIFNSLIKAIYIIILACLVMRSAVLKKQIQAMTNLTYIAPFFIVVNLKISVLFYVEKLGFKIRYIGPDVDPFYAMVGRENISIMLKAIAPDVKPIPNHTRHEWAPWDAYISTNEPDALFEEYRSNGVAFIKPIHDNSDDLRGFEIEDADGYVLFFGRPNS